MFGTRMTLLALVVTVASFGVTPSGVIAATTSTFVGGGWTLTLSYQQTAHGEVMAGTFRSVRHSYPVKGDWIPAADEGADLLRFYGHPFFDPKGSVGLVGVAELGNTCTPSCAGSTRYRLQEVLNLLTADKLPGVGRTRIFLQLKPH